MKAATLLAELGFKVGPMVANSMPIVGTVQTFDQVFDVKVASKLGAGVGNFWIVAKSGTPLSPPNELPLNALPAPLAALVETITFSKPLAFGPLE